MTNGRSNGAMVTFPAPFEVEKDKKNSDKLDQLTALAANPTPDGSVAYELGNDNDPRSADGKT
jgi:hypothetical protein